MLHHVCSHLVPSAQTGAVVHITVCGQTISDMGSTRGPRFNVMEAHHLGHGQHAQP